jgi:hypothetical protein
VRPLWARHVWHRNKTASDDGSERPDNEPDSSPRPWPGDVQPGPCCEAPVSEPHSGSACRTPTCAQSCPRRQCQGQQCTDLPRRASDRRHSSKTLGDQKGSKRTAIAFAAPSVPGGGSAYRTACSPGSHSRRKTTVAHDPAAMVVVASLNHAKPTKEVHIRSRRDDPNESIWFPSPSVTTTGWDRPRPATASHTFQGPRPDRAGALTVGVRRRRIYGGAHVIGTGLDDTAPTDIDRPLVGDQLQVVCAVIGKRPRSPRLWPGAGQGCRWMGQLLVLSGVVSVPAVVLRW